MLLVGRLVPKKADNIKELVVEEIYSKELDFIIMETKSEICKVGQHTKNCWAGANVAVLKQNFFFLKGTSLLLRHYNWLDEAHSLYQDNILYLKLIY